MNKVAIALAMLLVSFANSKAQFKGLPLNDNAKKIYRASADKINDLVHTHLDVKFDYEKSYMYGKAWITLKPHFYNTDSLRLDAKGMEIKEVAMMSNGKKTPLQYTYEDNAQLVIRLGRVYKNTEKYSTL